MSRKSTDQTSPPLAGQSKMARVGLNLTVRDLAEIFNLNKATIVRIEAGLPVRDTTAKAVREEQEAIGARFLTDADGGKLFVAISKTETTTNT